MQPTGGRKVNVSNSRREEPPKRGRAPREPKEPREKAKHPILRAQGRTLATLICLGIMVCSLAAVAAVYYAVQATANDGNLLDLDNIELSQSSTVVATDPDTGAQVEYATLRSSNSHRVWADLEQIPTNLQYAFICTEDKDFYNEPGVNFKRTIGAMVNEYLLPIYSSKQGASTLEQQLIKNLTSDKSASGVEGALRKLREIYRALCLSRAYSKETILEAYLNTISFTGTIQGVQTAANEYFNKDVSQLTLWECATIASITKNPTNYNPYTNPENLIHRRNFIMYNMWQQGIISEEDYRNGAAQPLVLAEEDTNKKTSSLTSYLTDALLTEVVHDIMDKEGVDESTAQSMLYTGGYTIEATVNPKMQTAMENLMLNEGDAYFPAGWHEEEVTSISDDDVQVMNADGTPKTRTGEDGTVYYGDTFDRATLPGYCTSTRWFHGTTEDTTVSMTGIAPGLTYGYSYDTTLLTDIVNTKQDIPVKATISIGDTNITADTTFLHTDCAGETWSHTSGDPAFLLHVRTCALTVTKTGGADGEPYVFNVYRNGNPYTQVTVVGNSSITIYELPVGKYTIEEDTGWSWRYDATYDPDKPDGCTLTAGHNSGSITCTNTLKNDRWLNGFSDVIANIFGIRH